MTTRTRPFNCCVARTCRPKGNILFGETTRSGKRSAKSADIPDDPETSFRRWKNKEIAAFDCEPTKDTPESAPIRHRDQVLGLLEQVIRDRAFTRTTVVLEEPVLQIKHKSAGHPFRNLPEWYQELKDR